MPKPPTKKRSQSEVAEEKALAAEVMLRKAALAYAEVAKLALGLIRFGGRLLKQVEGVHGIGAEEAEAREADLHR